jgi:hypothetical protein
MPCKPCAARREQMKKLAEEKRTYPQDKISIFYKQSTDEDVKTDKLKVHGRLPIYCSVMSHTCLDAVYRQCCVVEQNNACDKSNCAFGTERFNQILEEYDKRIEERGNS